MTDDNKLTWPSEKMAKFIDLTPRRLRQLVDEGVVPREERGRYNPFAVTVTYIRYLRDRVQSPELSNKEFFVAKLTKLKSECEQIELANQITRKERIPIDDVRAVNDEVDQAISGIIKASGLPIAAVNEIFDQLRDIPNRLGWNLPADSAE
jgi:phage terminase Nu1 subunit (DNA packaging protein)